MPFGEEQTDANYEYKRGPSKATVNGRPQPMKYTGHERDLLGWYTYDNTGYLDSMHARPLAVARCRRQLDDGRARSRSEGVAAPPKPLEARSDRLRAAAWQPRWLFRLPVNVCSFRRNGDRGFVWSRRLSTGGVISGVTEVTSSAGGEDVSLSRYGRGVMFAALCRGLHDARSRDADPRGSVLLDGSVLLGTVLFVLFAAR
ncbi:MAG TPA: hypothetical protein VND45_00880 [Thermoanaerobaculia bacterium]|nr:hypothetical protein [Thermoanaerobaculia bacterium]